VKHPGLWGDHVLAALLGNLDNHMPGSQAADQVLIPTSKTRLGWMPGDTAFVYVPSVYPSQHVPSPGHRR
jgi:hypothetical protein